MWTQLPLFASLSYAAVDVFDLLTVDHGTTYVTAAPEQITKLIDEYGDDSNLSDLADYYSGLQASYLSLIPLALFYLMAGVSEEPRSSLDINIDLWSHHDASGETDGSRETNGGNGAGASALGGLAMGAMGAVAGLFLL